MSFSLVHSAHTNNNGPSPMNLTVTASTAGNLAVVDINLGSNILTSVTDNGTGNTWHGVPSNPFDDTTDGQFFSRFYTVVAAGGSFTVVHTNGSANVVGTIVYGEYNSTLGWATTPLNKNDGGTLGTTTTAANHEAGNNINPLATDMLVGGYNDGGGNMPTIVAGTTLAWNFTATDVGINTVTGCTAQEWIASSGTGAQSATFTRTDAGASNNYSVNISSFSIPAAATTLPPAPVVVDFAVTRAASY